MDYERQHQSDKIALFDVFFRKLRTNLCSILGKNIICKCLKALWKQCNIGPIEPKGVSDGKGARVDTNLGQARLSISRHNETLKKPWNLFGIMKRTEILDKNSNV